MWLILHHFGAKSPLAGWLAGMETQGWWFNGEGQARGDRRDAGATGDMYDKLTLIEPYCPHRLIKTQSVRAMFTARITGLHLEVAT